MRAPVLTSLVAVLAAAAPAFAQHDHHAMGHAMPAAAFDPVTARFAFALKPLVGDRIVAGEAILAVLNIDDAAGRPVTGASVAGWMLLRRNAQVAAEMSCSAKAKLFTQGRVTARPDVDLNAAKMMILNRDGTIGIADPQVDFTITQMQAVVPLPGVPADWVMGADGVTLFVSLPVFGAVAVVDTRSFKMTGLIELGKGTLPTQLAALTDDRIAIYLSGSGSVAIAAAEGAGGPPVDVGPGPVAMTPGDAATLYVAAADGTVSAIDTAMDKVDGTVRRGKSGLAGEPSIAWAPQAGRLFVGGTGSDAIVALNPASLEPIQRMPVASGIFALAVEPGGGLLALNRAESTLALIDPATGTQRAREAVTPAPVELAFSHDYAYVRGLEGDHFTVVELAELARGRITALNVQSASRPVPGREALARARMVAPYGHGALVANAEEAVAYYYMEGMNSPMGTVKTYGPQVQGIMTADRSLRETAPGVYETSIVLPHGGVYDVPVVIGSDGFVTCFTATADPAPSTPEEAARASLTIEPEPLPALAANAPARIVFRITDARTGAPAEGLRDVRLTAFASGGAWQSRKWATDLGGGRYAAAWRFPHQGRYGVSPAVASRSLGPADTVPVYLDVRDQVQRSPANGVQP